MPDNIAYMSLPKPYYQDSSCTIYHGDCREILPQLGKADLLLTDPPYGIALDTDYSKRKSRDIQGRAYSAVIGDDAVQDFAFLFGLTPISIIFGANNWPQQLPFNPLKDGWIVWDKRTNEAADQILGSPFEIAVVIGRRAYEMIRLQHCGVKNADGDNSGRFHPTQKPIKLMARCISLIQKAETIIDPFCGSGSTLVAAKNLKRKAIGIEIEEKYCEIAVKRLRQEILL